MSACQLDTVSEAHLQRLCIALWSWELCENCRNSQSCKSDDCAGQRFKHLGRYFRHLKTIIASYSTAVSSGRSAAVRNFDDLVEIIETLRLRPIASRATITQDVFARRPDAIKPTIQDQDLAFDLAVQILFMIKCSVQNQTSNVLELGLQQLPWKSNSTFNQFITESFQMTEDAGLGTEKDSELLGYGTVLTARSLQKRAGLSLRPTSNLRDHLKLDRRNNVVEIFHHSAFIKEHLRLTKGAPTHSPAQGSAEECMLPRALLLETLDSLQKILFPHWDPKSRSLLRSLCSSGGFDPDCLRFEAASIRTEDENEIEYVYWGARLAELYEELRNPRPRGWIQIWLDRKSGDRYIMLATLIGVIFAVVLGIASLAVGGYQAWIGYQAWKYPVHQ